MIQLTYMIGNGFDLHLGLKTSYRDFYKYLKKPEQEEKIKGNEIIASILGIPTSTKAISVDKNLKVNPYETNEWSDLEAGIKKYLFKLAEQHANVDKINITMQNFHSVSRLLNEYLKSQNSSINLDFQSGLSTQGLLYPFEYLNKYAPDRLIRILNGIRAENNRISNHSVQANMSFIDFNYTDTLEKYTKNLSLINYSRIRQLTYNGQLMSVNKEVLYPNGKFGETIILGVGTKAELPDNLNLNKYQKQYLSKLEYAEGRDDGRVKAIFDRLDHSDVIIIYGMSIGESDATYFSHAIEAIKNNPNKSIIVVDYDDTFDIDDRSYNFLEEREAYKNKLLSCYEMVHKNKNVLDESTENKIRDRIFVEFDKSSSDYFPYSTKEAVPSSINSK
ncbi:MAG: AbiH family protein [Oenococcus oeni]